MLGLSGGVDSALVACVAVDALGAAAREHASSMPSPYSSGGHAGRRAQLAANLGVELLELPIAEPMRVYDELLAGVFEGREPDLTEENLQARIRGNLLMALSNKFGWLVLTTGNKSEMSVGYSTLYGDSAGGFAVIKDCPKLLVYRLIAHRARARRRAVPQSIITRPPSAELRPDQRDDDSLPPYEILDAILEGYVEQDLGREQLIARGLPAADVDRVIRLVDLAEYKRRQQPPGIKITTQGVRPRPARADHQPLRRLARTAIVIRDSAQSRPSSSEISISQTHVVRPRCLAIPTPWIVPELIGRRKDVWLLRPSACWPFSRTTRWVPAEPSVSANAA